MYAVMHLQAYTTFFVVDEYRDIRYAAYRTAFKIRHIQKRLKCKYPEHAHAGQKGMVK